MTTRIMIPMLALASALCVQAAPAAAHRQRPCREDVKRLCAEDQYSRAGIAACLERHADDLSPACQARVAKSKARIDEFQQACGADVQKICPTADRGRMTIRCLRDHDSDLSQVCRDKISEVRERHKKHDCSGSDTDSK